MDEQEIQTIVGDLKDYYHNFQAQCVEADNYYNLDFPVEEIGGYASHHPPTARVAIDDAAAQIDSTNIQVTVRPRNSTEKALAEAQLLRQFYIGCWHRVFANQGMILHRAGKHLNLYGVSMFKNVYDMDLWADHPEKESGESDKTFRERVNEWREKKQQYFPFVLMLCNPQNVMPDPSMSGGKYVVEKYRCKGLDIADRYPGWAEKKSSRELKDYHDWIEYWDREGAAYFVGDNMEVAMEYTPHNYGFIPYVIADGGLGYEAADGAPEKRWRGLLNPVYSDLRLESRLLFYVDAYLRNTVFMSQYFRATDPGVDKMIVEDVMNGWENGPATMNVLPYGIELGAPALPPLPKEVFELLGITRQSLDTATVAKVARGERPVGAASGYMTAVLAGLARIKFGPPLFALERACEKINEQWAMLVENVLPDKISVWFTTQTEQADITIGPKDIKGYYQNSVHLSSIAPEEESRKTHDGIALYQSGLISRYYAKEKYVGVENPDEDDLRIMVEQLLESPQARTVMANALLGMNRVEERAESILGEELPGHPLGNQGNPPSPFNQGYTPDRSHRSPLLPGSPEEGELVAKQVGRGPIGGKMTPWPT